MPPAVCQHNQVELSSKGIILILKVITGIVNIPLQLGAEQQCGIYILHRGIKKNIAIRDRNRKITLYRFTACVLYRNRKNIGSVLVERQCICLQRRELKIVLIDK